MSKKTIESIISREYLMTNGLGGYSFGTLDQVNARKYHGLYTVSLNPPIQRMHLVSKLEERFVPEVGEPIHLTPDFYEEVSEIESYLTHYEQSVLPQQTFQAPGIKMVRTHAFLYGSNMLAVRYDLYADQSGSFTVTPLFNFRDHHEVETPEPMTYQAHFEEQDNVFEVKKDALTVYIKFAAPHSPVFSAMQMLSPVQRYPIETRRGYPDSEQQLMLGAFTWRIESGHTRIEVIVHTERRFRKAEEIFKSRRVRLNQLVEKTGFKDPEINRLVRASDDFIVYRASNNGHTILAGYPWFTDWGRDTMIALPGLTLTTRRYREGLEMIEGFLKYAKFGVIPNNFPEAGEAPMYNTSDATLWLFNAMYAYYEKTGDKAALSRIYPQLMRILAHHIKGTVNEIYMDDDGLLSTGNERTQLTWMDVKVNGWVVTPRHGKAVEINALFYNAMGITNYFAEILGQKDTIEGRSLEDYMACTKKAFNARFWKEDGEESRLYDLIIEDEPIDIPRPNMIFAISLPFTILNASKWDPVVSYVEKHFKIDSGLLTLKREDPNFHTAYEGDLLSRDGAYHRGTAWGWLLGPFLEAHYKTHGDKTYVKEALNKAYKHLDEGVYGSFSEIFEGGFSHAQRGCPAQAWSVAELLRIYEEIVVESE